MRKKTHEEFVKEVYDLVGNEYTILTEYKGANIHIMMKHNKCNHEWNIKPSNFLFGKKCPKCAGVLKYTIEDAKKDFDVLGYDLLATEYKDTWTKMPYICRTHRDFGIQYATLQAIHQGGACKKCRYEKMGNSQRIDRDTIIQDYKNSGLILQSDFKYNEIHDLLPCICMKHPNLGIQFIAYNNIKHGHQQGCIRCGYERLGDSKRMSDEDIKILVESLDLEFIEVIKGRKTKVKVICPKHRERGIQIKMLDKLKQGQGCKYCNCSHGEKRIEKYLIEENIINQPQKSFDGLLGLKNGNLSYDFYLPTYNLLIEFQGEQHEHYCKWFHEDIEDFEKQIEHDRRKREYAKNNDYKLLEIWYYDFNNIEEILKRTLESLSIKLESV